MLTILPDIFRVGWFIILPVMFLVGLGFLIQKRLGLDMPTLIRLNFYVVVPGMIYFAVVDSRLSAGDMGKMVGFTLGAMCVCGRGSHT